MTPDASVLVVGAGPTGLMLATELALAGVRCRIPERRARESNLTRAFGIHARTLEVLDMRGAADEPAGSHRGAADPSRPGTRGRDRPQR